MSAAVPDERPVPRWVFRVALGCPLLIALVCELLRWIHPADRLANLTGWLAGEQADWLPFLPVLVLAPLMARLQRPALRSASQKLPGTRLAGLWLRGTPSSDHYRAVSWCVALLLGCGGGSLSSLAGRSTAGLPPAYHDEFSYLLQAETFAQGRLWFPSAAPRPDLFDQMHVLNEGRFASRYFPGNGLWLAPFVAIGHPWWASHFAHGLVTFLMFWTGRELTCNGMGLLAAGLFALSPGMLLFSTLLLAHEPTLVGLMLFLWAMLRWRRTCQTGLLLIAGSGLSGAMLCRPMTAAGFALPFGIAFVCWWLAPALLRAANTTSPDHEKSLSSSGSRKVLSGVLNRQLHLSVRRTGAALALGLPLIAGMGVMLGTNAAITGSAFVSPYQQYTDIYTPRHRYGFNNRVIGEQHLGPKTLDHYDRWAENLDAALAWHNVQERILFSLRWTFGIIPVLFSALLVLLTPGLGSSAWKLIFASIVSLHLVHVPYWFVGIMGWHYVLETAPLWILIVAEGSTRVWTTWFRQGNWGLSLWWSGVLLLTICVNLLTVTPIWPGRLPRGLAETAFSRTRSGQFRSQIEQLRHGQPVIVFVIPDPADRHLDYVTNPPDLSGPVLVARLRHPDEIDSLAALFPRRAVWIYDAATQDWRHLRDVKAP